MSETENPPVYKEHEGTIRVAGASKPLQLAQCVQALIARGVDIIEFFYIGGNAGQQAMKAMTILSYRIATESNGSIHALFEPSRVMTPTLLPDGGTKLKDASVWKMVLLRE